MAEKLQDQGGELEHSAELEQAGAERAAELAKEREQAAVERGETATEQLDEARQSVINMDDTWNIHNRKRTNMYCYHPGHQLRISLKNASDITDFVRSTDYETSELVSSYNMSEYNTYANHIKKRTFTSSVDDVIITEISGNSFTVDISIDDFESMHKFGIIKIQL